MRIIFSLPCLILALSFLILTSPPAHAGEKSYGQGVRLKASTPIGDILADPEAWEGKRVRVEGQVTGVCPKKGCWMALSSEQGEVRIKVQDDVIVFPRQAEGGHAVAEGVVQRIEMDRETYLSWKRHEAEEKGESFEEESLGEGPYVMVEIQGEGAVVEAEGL